jgi:hypothetical protein
VALVSGLTLADYLLWNWSIGGGHDVLAVVSGLSLVPLVLASAWLLVLSVTRLIAGGARRPRRPSWRAASGAPRAASPRLAPLHAGGLHVDADGEPAPATPAHAGAARESSGKIAA